MPKLNLNLEDLEEQDTDIKIEDSFDKLRLNVNDSIDVSENYFIDDQPSKSNFVYC